MMATVDVMDLYRTQFDRFEKGLRNGQSWTRDIRRQAISRFFDMGFPTTGNEEWKYTSVAPIAKVPFQPAKHQPDGLTSQSVLRAALDAKTENRLVFINGYYAPEHSSVTRLPEQILAGSLTAAMGGAVAGVDSHWARYASYQEQAFVALNTALMKDGAFIYLPQGAVLHEPIHLLYLSTGQDEASASYPRNLIVAESNSQVTVVESYVGMDDEAYFTNAVTEVVMGENAVVEHIKLQRESRQAFHVATLQIHQDSGSSFLSHSVALGGVLARNDLNAVLDGEGCDCTLNGLYLADGNQHVDHHTRVDHVKPHCTSRELYKGVLAGKSRGVFNGKIYVHPDARETDAKQTNKNLLLSEGASIDTKPQLEIYNNDVKCSHGSSVGQLDPNSLFYLRSRGIGLEESRALLTYAFASEVVGRIRLERTRSWLEETLLTRLQ